MMLALMLLAAAGCAPKSEQAAGAPAAGHTEAAAAQPAAFKIDRVSLPGEGRGDYITVDPDARRLYVTHTGSVHVIDLDSLEPLGEITGLKKAHGVALVPGAGRGFVSDGDANQVVVFDLGNHKVTKTLSGGKNPDSILYDPASKLVFVFNGTSRDASVIDPVRTEIVKTIPLGDKPEFSRADGQGLVFVNLEEGAAIAVIDTRALEVVRTYRLPDCEAAAALAFDGAHRRLFAGCETRQLKVVNADTGDVLASLPIGEDADGAAFDPQEKRIFVSNRDGTMTIIRQDDADNYSVEQNLATEAYAKTVAVDPKTHRVFTSTADLVWPQEVPGKKRLPDAKPGSFRLLVIKRG